MAGRSEDTGGKTHRAPESACWNAWHCDTSLFTSQKLKKKKVRLLFLACVTITQLCCHNVREAAALMEPNGHYHVTMKLHRFEIFAYKYVKMRKKSSIGRRITWFANFCFNVVSLNTNKWLHLNGFYSNWVHFQTIFKCCLVHFLLTRYKGFRNNK